jgi:hypothetical protein
MTMYYSQATRGFYDSAIHGDFVPADSLEITADEHISLLDAQSVGKMIVPSKEGKPQADPPPPPSQGELALAKIIALEQSVTKRRVREAVLGVDGGWLRDVDALIKDLRGQLSKKDASFR